MPTHRKPGKETPFMNARNLEDMETIRQSKRQIILYELRNTTHYGVELELHMAMTRPQMIQDLWNSLPNIAHDISSMTFKTQVAAIHKIHFIIVILRHLAQTEQHVVFLLESGIIRHLLLYIRNHPICRGHILLKVADTLIQLMEEYMEQAQQEIIVHGGAATFVRQLHSSQNKVKIAALKAISYTMPFPRQFKDALLDHGAVTLIAELLGPLIELPMLDGVHEILFIAAVLCLPGLCSGDPLPAIQQVEILIPIVKKLILTIEPIGRYSYIPINACWALTYILEILRTGHQLQQAREIGDDLCERLVLLMKSEHQLLVALVHEVVYELIKSENDFIQVLMNHEILTALDQNLHQSPAYQTLACETIYVMIYNNQAIGQQVLFDGNLMPLLVQIIQDDAGDNSTKEWVVIVLLEAARIGSDELIDRMVDLQCIQIFCEYLNDAEKSSVCVEGLYFIVQSRIRQREVAQLVGHFGGAALAALRDDEEVGEFAQWILENI